MEVKFTSAARPSEYDGHRQVSYSRCGRRLLLTSHLKSQTSATGSRVNSSNQGYHTARSGSNRFGENHIYRRDWEPHTNPDAIVLYI